MRKDGYYICEIAYDMMRGIFYWDSDESKWFTCGNDVQFDDSSFTYIANDPIDVYMDVPMTEVK